MKISAYRHNKPIILGDILPEARELPKLTDEQLLAMQPESTRKLLSMSDEEHAEYSMREIVDWKAPEIKIEEVVDETGKRIGLQVGDRFIDEATLTKHINCRNVRGAKMESFYRQDKTPLIDPTNTTGDYEAKTPEWKKNIAKKTAEPDHPRLAEFKQPKEQWVEAGLVDAFVGWLKGAKVRRKHD